MIKLGKKITWWIRSESDPRWNCEGMASINPGGGPPISVVETLEDFRIEYGPAPDDIEWGYSK